MYPLGNGTLAREVASAWCWDDGDGTTTSGCDVPRKSVGPLLPQSRYEGRFTVLITLDEASFDSYGERWGALPPECALAHPTAWRVIRCQLTVNYFTPDIGE